jgi:N-acetylmuramic acid 6-phosphate etherase
MSPSINYARLPTEQPNPRSRFLDRLSVANILRLMNREDTRVPRAVTRVIPHTTRAVWLIVEAVRRGGRLFFLGAGTSGRLGVIEAAECPPTFNTPPAMIQAIIAGGRRAVFRSREGAEDDRRQARREVLRRVRPDDVVVGIAASGITPFVEAGLRAAHAKGASTILVTCHYTARVRAKVDVLIAPQVGPELIAGSTRLKGGTATKLILNMLTVATMVRLGKVYGNLMVDVRPTSRKLRARALRIVQSVARCSAREAAWALRAAHGHVKTAILIATRHVSYPAARRQLEAVRGSLRRTLQAGVRPQAQNSRFSKRGV